ncbi:unnamed protein product [Tenebrio molitor]|nr:unnamed protein product [Tenebrio molitor]
MKTRTKRKANNLFREAKKTGGGQNTVKNCLLLSNCYALI